jgi:hypothetical protein
MDIWIPVVAVALPVGLIALSQVVERFVRLREKQIELAAGQAAEKAARYAANGAVMEQRVRVLERIVTDRGIDIADEIERLRDMPMPEKMRSN